MTADGSKGQQRLWLDSHQWELSQGVLAGFHTPQEQILERAAHKLLTLSQCFALFLLICFAVSSWVY